MVRAAVGKADLYALYFPKSSCLSFSSMFCHLFPFSFLPAGLLTGPVDEFKVILERYLIGASPTTISSSATATFGARASLIHVKSSSF